MLHINWLSGKKTNINQKIIQSIVYSINKIYGFLEILFKILFKNKYFLNKKNYLEYPNIGQRYSLRAYTGFSTSSCHSTFPALPKIESNFTTSRAFNAIGVTLHISVGVTLESAENTRSTADSDEGIVTSILNKIIVELNKLLIFFEGSHTIRHPILNFFPHLGVSIGGSILATAKKL